jgi:hypothetical protein
MAGGLLAMMKYVLSGLTVDVPRMSRSTIHDPRF